MSEENRQRNKLDFRTGLLTLQILLPFGLYLSLNAGNHLLAVITAALFGVSMLMLVVFK